jgi:2-keto-myo-inositol isomerase
MFFCSDSEREVQLNSFKEMLRVAEAIGCRLCVVCPEEIHDIPPAKIRKTASRVLRTLGRLAGERGIKVGFEFRGIRTNFAPNLESSIDLIDAVNHDSVGLVIDTAHFFTSKSSIADLKEFDMNKLLLIQVEDLRPSPTEQIDVDNDRVYPGDGIVPLRDILRTVRNRGYDGFISFETFATYWNEEPLAVARKAQDSFRALLNQL